MVITLITRIRFRPIAAVHARVSRREVRRMAREMGASYISYTIKRPTRSEMARGVAAERIVIFYKLDIQHH